MQRGGGAQIARGDDVAESGLRVVEGRLPGSDRVVKVDLLDVGVDGAPPALVGECAPRCIGGRSDCVSTAGVRLPIRGSRYTLGDHDGEGAGNGVVRTAAG
jgi:hypothetical protein